jgi:hypothetical protein
MGLAHQVMVVTDEAFLAVAEALGAAAKAATLMAIADVARIREPVVLCGAPLRLAGLFISKGFIILPFSFHLVSQIQCCSGATGSP